MEQCSDKLLRDLGQSFFFVQISLKHGELLQGQRGVRGTVFSKEPESADRYSIASV